MVRFITNFHKVNAKLVHKPYLIPKIINVMQKLEGFQWASSLNLNMGYYTIFLNPDAQKICTLIILWGNYHYLCLSMEISCTPDIFQEKISDFMEGL